MRRALRTLRAQTAAQVKDDELRKWYRDRVVWGNREFNRKMLANGLFARIHTPALLIMGLRVRRPALSVIPARDTQQPPGRVRSWRRCAPML